MRAISEREYNQHIKSAAWKATKREFLRWCMRHKRHYCWFCGETDATTFQVHHVRYEHFGNERVEDLTLICNRCHTNLHNRLRAVMSFQPKHIEIDHWRLFKEQTKAELLLFPAEFLQAVLKPPRRRRA